MALKQIGISNKFTTMMTKNTMINRCFRCKMNNLLNMSNICCRCVNSRSCSSSSIKSAIKWRTTTSRMMRIKRSSARATFWAQTRMKMKRKRKTTNISADRDTFNRSRVHVVLL